MRPFFEKHGDRLPNAGIFMSGSGSNAEALLNELSRLERPAMNVRAIITDAPGTSRARELGGLFGIKVIELDIKEFYAERGESRVSIATERGQEIREEWTNALRKLVAPLELDFGVFAGFVPLTNITGDFPCLNIHPGDLTYLKDGRRVFVGLHTIPIERVIVEGLDYMRSSVIVVEPYSGSGSEMDSGLLLGISPRVPVDFMGHSREELVACLASRPPRRPRGGYGDLMEKVASFNQGRLKEGGDWVVLPKAAVEFARGRYAIGDDGGLLHMENGVFTAVDTVEYGA